MPLPRYAWLVLILWFATPATAETITLYTSDSSIANNSAVTDTVTCTVKSAGWDIQVRALPPKRALQSLANQQINGYFAVTASDDLLPYAIKSDPIALETWYLSSRRPLAEIDVENIGTVLGSNEERWLKDNGYRIKMRVSAEAQLFALLEKQRIDTAVFDGTSIDSFIHTVPANKRQRLYSRFLRFTPVYLYVSRAFDSTHPDFISKFNQHLPHCLTDKFLLNGEQPQTASHPIYRNQY